MNRYRETLNRWAAQHVPQGATVTEVVIDYDDGWDPTYGEGQGYLEVSLRFRLLDVELGVTLPDEMTVVSSVGALLTELFAIEDEPT